MGTFGSERFSDQQEITASFVCDLLAPYELRLLEYELPKTGSGATTLLLRTDRGLAVMKIYRQWGSAAEDIQRRFEFVRFLKSSGLPVPQVFANGSGAIVNEFSTHTGPWLYVITERLPGRPLNYDEEVFLPEVARLQGALHQASASYRGYTSRNADLEYLIHYFGKLCRRGRRQKYAVPEEYLQMAENTYHTFESSFPQLQKLPSGLAHCDYDKQNILIHRGAIGGVFDFDNLGDVPFAADLGSSIRWFCSGQGWDWDRLSTYLTVYRRTRELSEPELLALPLFLRVQNLSDALHHHVHRGQQYTAERWESIRNIDSTAVEWARRLDIGRCSTS